MKSEIILPVLFKEYTSRELCALIEEMSTLSKVIMYDCSTDGKVTALIVDKPQMFLKRIITLMHFVLYLCNVRDELILSREIFDEYWSKKYNFNFEYETMTILDHNKKLKDLATTKLEQNDSLTAIMRQ